MGCHVSMFHEEWFTDPGPDDDWKRIIAEDPEMRIVKVAQLTQVNGDVVNFKAKGLAIWTKYSAADTKGPAFFFINKGRIVVRDADKEILEKTLQLASKLKAKVEGMDGSIYSKARGEKNISVKAKRIAAAAKTWWQI